MSNKISDLCRMYYVIYKYGPLHWVKAKKGIVFKKDVGRILSVNDELIIEIDHPDFQKICDDICGLVNIYEKLVTVMSTLANTLEAAQEHFDIKVRKNPETDPVERLKDYQSLVTRMDEALNPKKD